MAEPAIKELLPGDHCQFLRKGYFTVDKDSESGNIIINRTVELKDNWKKK